ncbi:A disintegrin and metallopeptidase domain 3-like [Sorex fumeus]|uniref:A disintegrin and metallopeptidase domain 3-like n=1 Tax=Sorex fumeus TaxID=62283 RepID=UPI0024ACCEEE|nr:A disintegrin and metallopeptidase domain 3-like [Sorex fumeus]
MIEVASPEETNSNNELYNLSDKEFKTELLRTYKELKEEMKHTVDKTRGYESGASVYFRALQSGLPDTANSGTWDCRDGNNYYGSEDYPKSSSPLAPSFINPTSWTRSPRAELWPLSSSNRHHLAAAHEMLSLLLIVSSLGGLVSGNQNSETSFLQIIVPKKIETDIRNHDMSETQVTYVIKIAKNTYTFHLMKQSFLDPHFHLYLSNSSGIFSPDSSFIKGHCFYQGYAAEIPESVVTLSTCSGLRGLLQLENVTYGIEPLETATTYEHILYQIHDNRIESPLSKENDQNNQLVDPFYKIIVKSEKKNTDAIQIKRFVKIKIIMDKFLFDYMGSEVAVATEKVFNVFGLINSMFSQLKVTVYLSSLEIWSDKNKIQTDGDVGEVLQRFVSWKEKFLPQRPHEVAYLLIYREHPNNVGASFHGKACDPKFASGVAVYPKMISLESFSVIMAQLIGVSFGLSYEEASNCHCSRTACIMNPEAMHSRGVKLFSSCSRDEFIRVVSNPEFECLQKKVAYKVNNPKKRPEVICGNGIKESSEHCDCGLPKLCTHPKCCNPKTCELRGNSKCGSGPCCDKNTCQIKERGFLCRESTDPCDFPEFCSGTSESCGPNIRALDLEPCNNFTSYCYNGECKDPDMQCSKLFGKSATFSTYLCSQEVNSQNDKFGNCKGGPCDYANIPCGKLVCHWTDTRIAESSNLDIQYTFLGEHICISSSLRSRASKDITVVETGTKCDDGKICNERFHCQCDAGYSPPNCTPTPSSPGGSLDDGNWILTSQYLDKLIQ